MKLCDLTIIDNEYQPMVCDYELFDCGYVENEMLCTQFTRMCDE